jgi:sulfite reductase alpha subunit-like flavoprotein
MPAGVKDTLAWVVRQYAGQDEDEAKDYVKRLEREGRIVEECWS